MASADLTASAFPLSALNNMGTGQNIKTLRKRERLTQEEFAALAGVTKETVCRWEKDRYAIRRSTLLKIASLFNLQLDDLASEEHGLAAKQTQEPQVRQAKEAPSDTTCSVFKIQMNGGRTGLKQTGTTELPSLVSKKHQGCYFVQMDTSAMSKCYPTGSLVLVDPNLRPWNGCSVLALADNSRIVIRRYSTGTNTVMLSSYSYRTADPDIVLDRRRVRILGVIVWFQASHDLSA